MKTRTTFPISEKVLVVFFVKKSPDYSQQNQQDNCCFNTYFIFQKHFLKGFNLDPSLKIFLIAIIPIVALDKHLPVLSTRFC